MRAPTSSRGGVTEPTLENRSEVCVVGSRVPELHVLVGPPGDARVGQWNLDLRAVGTVVKQLQRVCDNARGEHK